MYILIVSHGYPTPGDPQWGCFEKDQAEALIRLGHKVVIAAIDGRVLSYKLPLGLKHYQDEQISAYVHRLLPTRPLISKTLERWYRERAFLWVFKRIVQLEGMPDVIYAHYMFGMAQLRLVKQHYQIPILGLEHWSLLNKPSLPGHLQTLGRVAYSTVDQLMAVSPSLQNQIKKHFNVDSGLLYDMVNEIFLQQQLVEKSFRKPFKFVSVGSLNHWKAFDVLIEAFNGIKDKNAQLYIVGEGADRNALEEQIKKLNLSERVHLLGRLDKPSIIQKLSESDAFVLPSRGETFGVAYVEALAMGLPVIATRCGGPQSFMTDECGLMVDVDDVEGLTAAMDRMQETINSYDPNVIRKYIRSRFSATEIAKQIENHLNSVIGGG